ncbi:beta-phosphoglucomutase [Synechococcus sp. Lug-A]|nr:beta-phosphoglucomutase [Synechococcus sp. Lug-A]
MTSTELTSSLHSSCDSHELTYTDWSVSEHHFDPAKIRSRETVFTIGNGYMGTRGSFEEGYLNAMPATLVHGVYDDIPGAYTELANCPDWLELAIVINGDRFRLDHGTILHYERTLDLRNGILSRALRWRSPTGNTVDLRFERFASLADHPVFGLNCQITPVDFTGAIEIQTSLHGFANNQGFDHWQQLDRGTNDQGIWLHVRTRSSHVELGMAARMTPINNNLPIRITSSLDCPTIAITFLAAKGRTVGVEKVVTLITSQDVDHPAQAAVAKLTNLPAYPVLLRAHQNAWNEFWQQSDIEIEGDTNAQVAVRYNIFQLFIGACSHIAGECADSSRVSVPARTLSGFGYRGHVFWDTDIFILPLFTLTQPEIAKSLLTYRYHTLSGARRKAAHSGYHGAMFAWESAATGDEMTPRWSIQTDPYSKAIRIWCRDREIHISADIAYAAWHYWQTTGDDIWLRDYGAEVILDTAIFWMSRLEWKPERERFELDGVIGADEYHEQVNNNAYTNWMAKWNLETAVSVYGWLQQQFPDHAAVLAQKLQLNADRLRQLQAAIAQLYTPYDTKTGLIEQFDQFFDLRDIHLNDYEPRNRSMQDVLGMDMTNQSQVLKQPDVLMLLYLMRDTNTCLSYPDVLEKNWNYYTPRTDTTYGSSLCPAILSILAAKLGKEEEAYHYFMQAATVDLEDSRGNTADGIHAASAGGVWQAVVFGFAGIHMKGNSPMAIPHLPPTWKRLRFKLQWRGTWHSFDLSQPAPPPAQGPAQGPTQSQAPDIKGFIFDVDGVLTNTSESHYRAWQRLADEEKLPFDRKANEALRGVSRRGSLLQIIGDRHYSESALQDMMERKNRYYLEDIQTITPQDMLPGAIEFLQELRQAKMKIAIGSASKNARTVIDRLGIGAFIDAIADGDSVQRPKPAPDIFQCAAAQLNLAPANCVVVEDAAVGIEAAIAAGMWSVGIGPQERVGAANIVLPDLDGVRLSDLGMQW